MVSDLAEHVNRISPLINRAQETVVENSVVERGETDLLEEALCNMFDLIKKVALFICDYVKESPASMFHLSDDPSVIWCSAGRAIKATISSEDQNKIRELVDAFGKLGKDFDRAVNVENLITIRNIGKYENSLIDTLHLHHILILQMKDSFLSGWSFQGSRVRAMMRVMDACHKPE